ncbi:hypothetical protein DM558_06075 [Entomomonas moraniae]|uniref:Peptidase S24/S26A/S26B/S26C domain-containing protein n=2 Tax=Entomomonas moraniae TaxID=2213226 RepID=A0A3Q9JIK1_9GAMM|nr:hypothetical protein DM558_06075 [Entomomonas moraniae]
MLYNYVMNEVKILGSIADSQISIPLALESVRAGYPVETNAYVQSIKLTDYVTTNPAATFYARSSVTVKSIGISENDILIIDRSIEPEHNHIVVAIYQGEHVIRRVHNRDNALYLVSPDETVKPVRLVDPLEQIFGVIVYNIHSLKGMK